MIKFFTESKFLQSFDVVSFLCLSRVSRSARTYAHTLVIQFRNRSIHLAPDHPCGYVQPEKYHEISYLIAGVKTVRGVELALGLAAAIWQRGRSDERLMMEFEFRSRFHRVAVGLPLAGEMRSAPVP